MSKLLLILLAACECILVPVTGIMLPIRGNRYVVPKVTTDGLDTFHGGDPPRDYPGTSYTPSLRDKGLFLPKPRPIYSDKYYEAQRPKKEEIVTKGLYTESYYTEYPSGDSVKNHSVESTSLTPTTYIIPEENVKIPDIPEEIHDHGQPFTTFNLPTRETPASGYVETSLVQLSEYMDESYPSYPSKVLSEDSSYDSAITSGVSVEPKGEYPVLAANQKLIHFPGGYTISTYYTPTPYSTHSYPESEVEQNYYALPERVIYPVPVAESYGRKPLIKKPVPGDKYISYNLSKLSRRRLFKKIFRFVG